MAKYSKKFKIEAVKLLRKLSNKEAVRFDKKEVKDVESLVKALGISKWAIYSWEKIYAAAESKIDELLEKIPDKVDLKVEKIESELLPGWKKVAKIGENDVKNQIEFGTRFWQFVAKNMGIKNYAIPLKQLKLKIGTHLINGTGLVESNKNVKKELRLD